jgi:hypothetical protein
MSMSRRNARTRDDATILGELAAVRSSALRDVDWMLMGLVAASFVIHFSFVGWLAHLDRPRSADPDELPDRFVQIALPPPPLAPVLDTPVARSEKHGFPSGKHVGAAPRRADLKASVSTLGVLSVIGARGEGGSLVDQLQRGDAGSDPDRAFASMGGVTLSGGDPRALKLAAGPGTRVGGGKLRIDGPANVAVGERASEHATHGVVLDVEPRQIEGALDPAIVARELRSRIGAVRACYERGLDHDHQLGGKLTLRFTLSAAGRVVSVDVESDTLHDDAVVSCIRARAQLWHFPESTGAASFSFPFVFQPAR